MRVIIRRFTKLIWLSVFIHTSLSYEVMNIRPKIVHRGGILFECPHWSVTENTLYWVDMNGQKVYRLDANTKTVTSRSIDHGIVSVVVPVKNNPKLMLTAVRAALYLLPWDSYANDTSLRLITAVDLGLPDNNINDGKVDAKGRLWFGTKGKQLNSTSVYKDRASLYMMDMHNYRQPEIKLRPVSISNGIAWSDNSKLMFYNDSPTRKVDAFDYDLEKGLISNRHTVFSFEANNITGVPDGMTIDTDGNLWVACFRGWKVIKIDPRTGKLLEIYPFPVAKVSSVMFGGPGLSTLYVTTGRVGLTPEELAYQPDAGSLFAITRTGARGLPEHQFSFSDASSY